MSRILWKSFHLCFPSNLIKCSSSPCLPPPPSSAVDQDDPNRPSLLLTNFNSLYDHDHPRSRRQDDSGSHLLAKRLATAPSTSSSSTTPTATATSAATATASSSSDDFDNYYITPTDDSLPPDFAAAFASRRFFFSSPGRSNAITDSPESRSRELSDIYSNATTTTASGISINTATESQENYNTATAITTTTTTVSRLLSRGAAVKYYVDSPDPYRDFRRSMEEMIEAKDLESSADQYFEFLHELLFSYLALNPRDTHEFVVKAFTDVLVSLLSDGRRKF